MSLAPKPQLAACLRVLYLASVKARSIGWAGHAEGLSAQEADQIADLMDAVHNLPYLVENWEKCDESLLRITLGKYDERWSGGLLQAYDDASARSQIEAK